MHSEPGREERLEGELLRLTGIDATSGRPLVEPPLSVDEIAERLRQSPVAVTPRVDQFGRAAMEKRLALPADGDAGNLAQTGWAVVFTETVSQDVRDALQPLLDHRRAALGSQVFKQFDYPQGYPPEQWINDRQVYPGGFDAAQLPYYVLLVGGPEAIPFELQYELGVEYAVGRLAFDTAEEYACYARSVVAYETGRHPTNAREVVFWSPRIPGDRATELSEGQLVGSLCDGVPGSPGRQALSPVAGGRGFRPVQLRGDKARRADLAGVLHRTAPKLPPAVLLGASHGLAFPRGHAEQLAGQGALLCQDWRYGTPAQPGDYLPASGITDDARVHGMVAFLFACYGAGTPARDDFPLAGRGHVDCSAKQPFVAALPRRLLAHPGGAALAVIAHIERAWGFSIQPPGQAPQIMPFRNLLYRLLGGEPVGHAARQLGEKYALLSAYLLQRQGKLADLPDAVRAAASRELVPVWIDRTDYRNYVVLGDPAVRLRLERMAG